MVARLLCCCYYHVVLPCFDGRLRSGYAQQSILLRRQQLHVERYGVARDATLIASVIAAYVCLHDVCCGARHYAAADIIAAMRHDRDGRYRHGRTRSMPITS